MVFDAGRAKYKFASFWNRNHALRGLQRASKKFEDLQEQIKKARKLSCRFCDRCGLIFGNSLLPIPEDLFDVTVITLPYYFLNINL